MKSNIVRDFVLWCTHYLAQLRDETTEVVADAIARELSLVDTRLGVEVSDESEDNQREAIFTAYSEPSLFPMVREIVNALPDIPGWRFVALKPARGFQFALTVGEHRVQAKSLEFLGIPNVASGVQLLLPSRWLSKLPVAAEAEELAWLIVETGAGEELCAKLQHVEFSGCENARNRRPITDLPDYLRRL